MNCTRQTVHHTLGTLAIAILLITPAAAQIRIDEAADGTKDRKQLVPEELRDIGVDEHRGAKLPMDAVFVDENGRHRKLGRYFDGKKPVLITLNYYSCEMLCNLQLNGLVDALKRMKWTPGEQFRILTVSFDPSETPQLARNKKRNYLGDYGRPAADKGWHFLTGELSDIHKLTEAVGFHYKWNPEIGEWAHNSVLLVCSPDGSVSRYLGGVMYEPDTLRLSMVEASKGEVGSVWDQVFLACGHYDPNRGSYAIAAEKVMYVLATGVGLLLFLTLAVFWYVDRQRRRSEAVKPRSAGATAAGPTPPSANDDAQQAADEPEHAGIR